MVKISQMARFNENEQKMFIDEEGLDWVNESHMNKLMSFKSSFCD